MRFTILRIPEETLKTKHSIFYIQLSRVLYGIRADMHMHINLKGVQKTFVRQKKLRVNFDHLQRS